MLDCFTFDFDKFILISNLQATDVSFMPRVAVWISLHAWLIHGHQEMWNRAPTPNRYASPSELHTSFPSLSWDFSCFLLRHSKWMDNLNVDWSSGSILSCFFGCERKIHKPKPWINQACKEIHTATLGMKLTSVVCKLEIKINLS